MNTQSWLPLRRLLAQMKALLIPWLIAAVVLGLVVVIHSCLSLSDGNTVSAAVNFGFDGVESGYDPSGGRFDPDEMKNAEVIREAAASVGLDTDDETVARIRNAINIHGSLPADAVSMVADYSSKYDDGTPSQTQSVRNAVYYPSQYVISLHCRDAGCTASQAAALLDAILSGYQQYFFRVYGYNASFEQAIRSVDYNDYDYLDAIDLLDSNLNALGYYVQWLSSQSPARFVSRTTGYSFEDLNGAISTLRSEDIDVISAFAVQNSLTKNREELLNNYAYKIQSAERRIESNRAMSALLDSQIQEYVKTTVVVVGSGDEDASGYEVSQQSETYNNLIRRKVSCEAEISTAQEEISRCRQRLEQLSANLQPTGQAALEEQLAALNEKVSQLLSDTRQTAEEYFETVRFQHAFQVLSPARSQKALKLVIRAAFAPVVAAEAVLFGVFLLLCAAACLCLREDADITKLALRAGMFASRRAKR